MRVNRWTDATEEWAGSNWRERPPTTVGGATPGWIWWLSIPAGGVIWFVLRPKPKPNYRLPGTTYGNNAPDKRSPEGS